MSASHVPALARPKDFRGKVAVVTGDESSIPRDQRTVGDAAFLEGLRLPGVAGQRLRLARASAEEGAVVAAVAAHFRTRAAPQWAFYMHGTPWLERDGAPVRTKADDLLDGVFHGSWPPYARVRLGPSLKRIDWPSAMRTLGCDIERNTFLPVLTTAHALTGDTAYLSAARQLLRDFVKAAPFVLEDGFLEDHDRYFGGACHSTLGVGLRTFRWLDLLHCGAFQAPGVFTDADLFWFVKQLWFYATQFRRMCDDPLRRDNHHLTDHGHIPYVLGLMFPEFDVATALLRAGRRVIRYHATHNLFDDGCYAEHSTRYQYHIAFAHLHALACARINGDRLHTAAQQSRLSRWVEFLAHACRPDGSLASFGDEAGGQPANLFDVLAAPVMTGQLTRTARMLGYRATREILHMSPAELTTRHRRKGASGLRGIGLGGPYLDTSRPAAAAPTRGLPPSARYPLGGFTFFRDGWTPDADYLAVSHYTASMPHGHTHWDMMSFVLHTQGQTLIGDPATCLYNSPRIWSGADARDLRGYSYSVDAHNCLTVDDDTLKPIAYLGHRCVWGCEPPRHGLGLFKAGHPIEVAEFWHDANHSCRHRRFVVFCRGIGFAFADIIEQPGLDLRPHDYTQAFHFEPGVRLAPRAPAAGGALLVTRGSARCTLLPGGEMNAVWSLRRDDRLKDVSGACEPRSGQGPWVARLTRCQQGPSVFTTFLATRDESVSRVTHLGSGPARPHFRQTDGISANRLDLAGRPALLLVVNPFGRAVNIGGIVTDAELASVTFDADRRPSAWVLVRGSHLALDGHALYCGRRTAWHAS